MSGVDYQLLVHGGFYRVSGSGLTGATSVTVGGISQSFSVDGEDLLIEGLDDETPTGSGVDLVVQDAGGASPAFSVTVAHLVLTEIDADAPTASEEFIELTTGLNFAVDLTGYSVVLLNGNCTNGVYRVFELGMTGDDGFFLIAGDGLGVTGDISVGTDNWLQNGEDGVAIIQGDDTGFTTSAACDAQPSITTQPIIDGVAYRSGNDDATTLPQLLYSSDPGSAINEGDAAGDREDVSVVRCDFSSARRDQSQWSVPAPGSDKRTPNAANDSVCE